METIFSIIRTLPLKMEFWRVTLFCSWKAVAQSVIGDFGTPIVVLLIVPKPGAGLRMVQSLKLSGPPNLKIDSLHEYRARIKHQAFSIKPSSRSTIYSQKLFNISHHTVRATGQFERRFSKYEGQRLLHHKAEHDRFNKQST